MSDTAQIIPQLQPGQNPVVATIPMTAEQELLHKEEIHQKLEAGAQISKHKILTDKPTDMDMALLTVDVEKDLLFYIIVNLEKNSISYEQSQQLAREFLSLLPLHDKQDLLDKLLTVRQKNPGVNEVYVKYAVPFEEEEKQRKLEEMHHHIQNGNIDHAITIAKGGTINA